MFRFVKSFWLYIVGLIVIWTVIYIQRSYEVVRVPEGMTSMSPALQSNMFYKFQQLNLPGKLRYGDIVFIRFKTEDEEKDYFGRVVGLGGDRIALRKGRLIRNGEVVDEPYLVPPVTPLARSSWEKVNMPEVVVPAGCVFLLNDDRVSVRDSRTFGAVDAGIVRAFLRK